LYYHRTIQIIASMAEGLSLVLRVPEVRS